MSERWISESLHPGLAYHYLVDRVHHEEGTGNHHLVIFDNKAYGRMMTLDGIAQVCSRAEFVYHEIMTHVPIFAHGGVRKVLIIGGGDGGILREVLRHQSLESVTMVEIDQSVVETCRQHLPDISAGAFDHPKARLVIADGAAFVQQDSEHYDVIIVDSTDPIGPAEVLFSNTFYGHCRNRLTPGGILVTQNGLPFLQPEELRNTMDHLRVLFKAPRFYLQTVPFYLGGPMAFGWGTDDPTLWQTPLQTLKQRFAAANFPTRHYTPEIHRGCFDLPPWIAEIAGM